MISPSSLTSRLLRRSAPRKETRRMGNRATSSSAAAKAGAHPSAARARVDWVPAFAGTAGCTWFYPGRVGQTGRCRTRNDRAFLVIASDAPESHATSGDGYLYKMIFEVMIS